MRRLFWRFFAVVWLTMSASIGAIVAINIVFGVLPPPQEEQRTREKLVLDLAGQMLASKGPVFARAYLDAVNRQTDPVVVDMRPVGNPIDCASADQNRHSRNAVYAGTCYLLSAASNDTNWIADLLPRLLPWIAAAVTSLGSAYLIARYLVGPIARLRYGLSALAGGDFAVRIGQKSAARKDEIMALAQDFDVTAARLQELHESQQRLFHDVSHELRSPLSRLQAAMGVLRKNTSRLDVMLPRMDREIEQLDNLVEEILTLARLSTFPQKPLETQEIDVVDLIKEIVADARFEGTSRNIEISYDGVDRFVARLDGELIYRAIENVVRNAIKYTAEGSVVEVSTQADRDELQIRIRDHGPAVPQDQLEMIFEPFSRAHSNAVLPGHGLGLAITKRAVERHGGTVRAERHPTGGLVVSLCVPRRLPAHPTRIEDRWIS